MPLLVIPPQERTSLLPLPRDRDQLPVIQRIVGGYVEWVTLDPNTGLGLLVNEDGKLQHLSPNLRASRLFQLMLGITDDLIVGTAVVVRAGGEDMLDLGREHETLLQAFGLWPDGQPCPRCGWYTVARPYAALSRTDNETEVCPTCGVQEGLEAAAGELTPKDHWPLRR